MAKRKSTESAVKNQDVPDLDSLDDSPKPIKQAPKVEIVEVTIKVPVFVGGRKWPPMHRLNCRLSLDQARAASRVYQAGAIMHSDGNYSMSMMLADMFEQIAKQIPDADATVNTPGGLQSGSSK